MKIKVRTIDPRLVFADGRFFVTDMNTLERIDVTDEVRKALKEARI